MTDDHRGSIALVGGTAATLVTMIFHPTGHDLFGVGQLESVSRILIAVHALALLSMPVLFLGALALSQRVAMPDRVAIAALVVFSFALAAGMTAATVSGLVAPGLAREIIRGGAAGDVWKIVFNYNGRVIQGFAQVFVAASSGAIVLWSASILRSRALGRGVAIYGLLIGPVIVIALASGHLKLRVHGFGLVVVLQAVWLIIVGVLMWLPRPTSTRAEEC